MLAFDIFDGPDTAPPCLIAHGLYGSGRNWGVIAKRLSASRKVITVDMRNHGESFWSDDHSYPAMADDLAEVITAQGAPIDVIGHSMGGKAAMMLALNHSDAVNRLIVADIAPVTYTHSQMPMIKAMRAVDLSRVSRRSEAAAQLAEQGIEPALQSFFTQSLDVAGKRWRYNLDALAGEMPKIMSFPETDAEFAGPILFLAGAKSDYVQREHRPVIKARFPNARFAKLPDAGHWLHADNPRGFQKTVEVFFNA